MVAKTWNAENRSTFSRESSHVVVFGCLLEIFFLNINEKLKDFFDVIIYDFQICKFSPANAQIVCNQNGEEIKKFGFLIPVNHWDYLFKSTV